MRLSHLRALYESDGPFATAYVRTTRDAATASHQVELRARHLAEQLSAQGAPAEAGDAIETAVRDEAEGAPAERVLVWAGGRIVFDADLPETGEDETATWGPLPDLLEYARAYANTVPHVVAVVDRVGGDLTAVDALGQVREIESVDGTTFHLRKVKVGGWSQLHYLHHAEERWKANADDVAVAVDRLIEEVQAEQLVVAGDVRAREKLHEKLSVRGKSLLTEIEHGGRAEGVDEEAFDHAVHERVEETAHRMVEERCAMFTERMGKKGAAAEGLSHVVAAASQAKLDTLLIGENFKADADAWIGTSSEQISLTRKGLETLGADLAVKVPAGSALLRSAVLTDGEVLVVPPDGIKLRDGIGALLRF